ncbi:MAG: 4Fe-4S dicluster domain-containing protein, partial [Chloroflexota bacterium]
MSRPRFIIDLATCTGCGVCAVACRDRADLPDEAAWLRLVAEEAGAYPRPSLTYRVVHCFHCAHAPCAAACPVGAIARQEDDWVQLDEALCTGCGACLSACPFGAIAQRAEGVATKCDGCADEVARGWPPTCVRACPMRALAYADDNEGPGARVADPAFSDHGA